MPSNAFKIAYPTHNPGKVPTPAEVRAARRAKEQEHELSEEDAAHVEEQQMRFKIVRAEAELLKRPNDRKAKEHLDDLIRQLVMKKIDEKNQRNRGTKNAQAAAKAQRNMFPSVTDFLNQ